MSKRDKRTWIPLTALVLQNTSLVLLLRYSRTMKSEKYLSSTAIVTAELIKGFVCLGLVWFENGNKKLFPLFLTLFFFEIDRSISRLIRVLNDEIYSKPHDTSKLAIPSGLYAIQNNLLFLALTYLNAATYQVTYQLKILTTALCWVFMLNKTLEKHQWFSLFMLAMGVALVTWPSPEETIKRLTTQNQITWLQQCIGFGAVLLASLTSGFAGVYFEKVLKTGPISVWVRNIQLGNFELN